MNSSKDNNGGSGGTAMRRRRTKSALRHVAAALAVCCTLGACDKVPINGVLDGMWQLTSIQTPDARRNTTEQQLYVSFQLHLTQWEQKTTGATIFAHFTHRGDSMRFYDFADHAMHDLSAGDDDRIFTPAQMAGGAMDQWGIHTTDARFRVMELNHTSLVLQAADTTLTFRKF